MSKAWGRGFEQIMQGLTRGASALCKVSRGSTGVVVQQGKLGRGVKVDKAGQGGQVDKVGQAGQVDKVGQVLQGGQTGQVRQVMITLYLLRPLICSQQQVRQVRQVGQVQVGQVSVGQFCSSASGACRRGSLIPAPTLKNLSNFGKRAPKIPNTTCMRSQAFLRLLFVRVDGVGEGAALPFAHYEARFQGQASMTTPNMFTPDNPRA